MHLELSSSNTIAGSGTKATVSFYSVTTATGAVSSTTITPGALGLAGSTCSNVVQSVSITYTIDAAGSLKTPRVVVYVADSINTGLATQTDRFTFTFANTPDLTDTTSVIGVVGNPGYSFGDPVLVLFDGLQELTDTTVSKRGIPFPPVTTVS